MDLKLFILVALAAAANVVAGPIVNLTNSAQAEQCCCTALQQALPGLVFSSNSATYSAANADRWSVTSILRPSCIALPRSAHDVSTFLNTLVTDYEHPSKGCPFAIKSGGGMSWAGANDIDNGIVLDLSWINGTELSWDQAYATIGSSSKWLDVYQTLDGTGFGVPGARCGTTGVGGVTLGGGISFFSPKVGFVADNVLNFEVVLASGKIVNANASNHGDLFLALKGGSSNYGIVTRFDIATFESNDVYGAGIVSPLTDATTSFTLRALHGFVNDSSFDTAAIVGSIFYYDGASGNRPVITSVVDTKNEHSTALLKPFKAIHPQLHNTLRSASVTDLVSEGSTFFPRGQRDLMATMTFRNDLITIQEVQVISHSLFDSVQHVPGVEWIYSYEPLPRLYTDHSIMRGGNIMGLDRTQDDLILTMLAPRWSSAANDAVMAAAATSWVEQIRELTAVLGTSDPFIYLNYAEKFQDPFESYGAMNDEKMKAVAAKYDPGNVFGTLVPGGFKLR